MTFFSVSDAAREVGCRPRDISDAFYNGYLDESRVSPHRQPSRDPG